MTDEEKWDRMMKMLRWMIKDVSCNPVIERAVLRSIQSLKIDEKDWEIIDSAYKFLGLAFWQEGEDD